MVVGGGVVRICEQSSPPRPSGQVQRPVNELHTSNPEHAENAAKETL